MGLAHAAEEVSPDLSGATIASVVVLGAFRASPAVKAALAGRIAEATATIQRTLGNLTAPDVAAADRSGASVPPGPFRVVDDSAPAMRTPGRATVSRTDAPTVAETARPAALPPLPFPDVLRRPGGTPGAPGRVRPVTSDRVTPPAGQFVDG